MDPKENPISVPPQEDLTEVRKPTSLLVAQFFLFPLIIIAFGVGIFVLFGYIAYDEKSPESYLAVIRQNSGYFDRRRWQAASELTSVIASRPDELGGSRFAEEVLAAYVEARPDPSSDAGRPDGARDRLLDLFSMDPDQAALRRFLAMCLGHLEHGPAVPALVEGLSDPDAETQIWTMWAIGKIADASAAPAVAAMIGSGDPGVRKMAVYVLGALGDRSTIPALAGALGDPAADVQWNAAMSLARMNDASGLDVLISLTDRDYLAGFTEMSEEDREVVITNAVQCLGLLQEDRTRDLLAALIENDPSLRVRVAAQAALATY
jgi:HEAT repeat protein